MVVIGGNKVKFKWKMTLLVFVLFILLPQIVSADFKQLSGDLRLHDPSIIKEGNTWWAFGTGEGKGLKVLTSNDGSHWSQTPSIFPQPLNWWSNYVPNFVEHQWAPDVEYYNGRYWVFYSVSSFGSNTSLIGLTSTESIQSGNWRDDGLVIRSTSANNYNAIDGDLIIDKNGEPWLSFGSFWSGIKLTKLDPNTMKPIGNLYSIAARPNHPEHAIEAPSITYKDGYYYLFVSFDKCCSGVNSTYKIAYGRSTNITGPYLDKNGIDMLHGGGTILEDGLGQYVGTGHQDILNNDILVRHGYDTQNNGVHRMLINDLYWDAFGWPTLDAHLAAVKSGSIYKLVNRASGKVAEVLAKSTSDGADVIQWTDNGGLHQQWRLNDLGNGYYSIINVNSNKALEIFEWSNNNGADAVQYSYLGGENQQWQIQQIGNGYVKIINRHSGKVLDGYGTTNGSDILQYDDHNGLNQQWQLVKVN